MGVEEMTTQTYSNFINGEWAKPARGQVVPSENPADTRDIVGYVPVSTAEDVERAVAAAKQAYPAWAKMPSARRAQWLYRAADILEARMEEMAETVTREMGKTLAESRGEVARGITLLRYYAGEGLRRIGEVIPSSDGQSLLYTLRVPLGVVGLITPWNFPVAIPLWKAAPALVYGNTVVLKPSPETSVTAAKLAEVFAEAGLPAGVFNVVMGGAEAGRALVAHPDVHGVSFTGSDVVGQEVARVCAARGAKYQLEMGGKNPVIVAEDADLELAAELTVSGAMRMAGQKCTATSRAIVLAPVYDAFRERVLEKVRAIRIGDGRDPETWMGPLVSARQREKVLAYISRGKAEGARLLVGGGVPQGEAYIHGYFVEPTIFDNVDPDATIAQDEIFGPVLALIKVNTLEEAIAVANRVRFGLSASLFTRDIGKALTFVEEIEAGMIRVNGETAGVEPQAPFGGMKASSSHSREQGTAAMEFYTQVKTVAISRG